MPSSFMARMCLESEYQPRGLERNGNSRFATTASAFRRSTPTASLSSSNGFTPRPSIPARGLAWPFARRSSNVTVGASGLSPLREVERRFASRLLRRRIKRRGENRMNFESQAIPVDILLVEDNAGDVRLTQEVLKGSKVRNNLMVATNGKEALNCLRRQGKYSS